MKVIHRSELKLLVRVQGPCASIYLPLSPRGREEAGNPLRLEHAAIEVAWQLTRRGFQPAQVQELLSHLPDLAKSKQGAASETSMAILLGPSIARYLSLDTPLGPEVWGDDHFHLRPLLPFAVESDRFFLLALSERHVQLYEGDAEELRPVDVPGLPRNIDDALQIDGVDRGSQTHSANAGGHGRAGAMFHGHGGKADTAKTNLEDYFRRVTAAIEQRLLAHREPLVLATVAENVPIWREVSRYPHPCGDFVPGSPDYTPLTDLHKQAWGLVHAQLAHEGQNMYSRLCNARGTSWAILGLSQVLPAAVDGMIDTLFVDCRKPLYGKFDRESGEVRVQHCVSGRCDSDLLEVAIREALQHHGRVFARDDLADHALVEALLRY